MLQYNTHSENNKNQVKYLPMVNISVTHCLVRGSTNDALRN